MRTLGKKRRVPAKTVEAFAYCGCEGQCVCPCVCTCTGGTFDLVNDATTHSNMRANPTHNSRYASLDMLCFPV